MKRLTLLLTVLIVALGTRAIAAPADNTHAATGAALATDAHAATGHADGPTSPIAKPKEGIPAGITAIVVFVIVFAILATAVWPKITAGLEARNNKIQSEIAAAEEARRQAREALNEYERNLAEARAESQKMLESTRAQQTALAAELKAKADIELNALREKAKSEIEAAKKQALSEIYTESVTIATAMAGKILQREVTVTDQQRLMEESMAELKTANA